MENKLYSYMTLATEHYTIVEREAPVEELNFYLRYAIEANGPILEPMCGTGNYLIPILEKGLSIEGVDASPQMLSILKLECHKKNFHPKLHECFIQDLNLGKYFDLIIIPNWSFGLITGDNQIRKTLAVLFQHLSKKGKLVFGIETTAGVPSLLNIWYGENEYTKMNLINTISLSRCPSYDESTQLLRILNRYEKIQNNRVVETEFESLSYRLYKDDEMIELLKETGFSTIKEFYLEEQNNSEQGNSSIIYECQKD
ncbi:MAG: class I SAM-dependent methyltransferase [Legionellaceae bacterium]|nr:class I SAM-dependent methyltransferase [Legionellaceae bacterium]